MGRRVVCVSRQETDHRGKKGELADAICLGSSTNGRGDLSAESAWRIQYNFCTMSPDHDRGLAPGKQPNQVRAGSLLCYWAVRELGMGCTVMGQRLSMTQPGVSKAVPRGEGLAERDNLKFIQDQERIL